MAGKAAGREGGPRQNAERYFWEALSAEGRVFNSGMVLPLRIKDGNLWIWKSLFNFPCRFCRCFVCSVPGLQLSIDCYTILFDEGHFGAYWRRTSLLVF
jgi:hypothetical protein